MVALATLATTVSGDTEGSEPAATGPGLEIADRALYDRVRELRDETRLAVCTLTELLDSWPGGDELPRRLRDRVQMTMIGLDLVVGRALSGVGEAAR